jgi:hypothetical protein
MKAYGGVDVYIQIFLTLALAGGEWSASRLSRLNSGERVSGTHWLWGWVDLRAGLDDLEKRKFLNLLGLELWPFSSPAYTDYAIQASFCLIVHYQTDTYCFQILYHLCVMYISDISYPEAVLRKVISIKHLTFAFKSESWNRSLNSSSSECWFPLLFLSSCVKQSTKAC